jgi:two-component system, chemotaxis family, CheB/CheR fusion protein
MISSNPSPPSASGPPSLLVGIGSSAGGLEALTRLFHTLPTDKGIACVVVQHLSPNYRSMLVQLLARESTMPVFEAMDGQRPQANTIYITPPNRTISLRNGIFELVPPALEIGPKPSVNIFFSSLATNFGENSIGVILSGTGSDGASGIYDIKAAGGFTFAQTPESAKYPGMPMAAIATRSIDWVLPPEEIGHEISRLVDSREQLRHLPPLSQSESQLQRLLIRLRQQTRVDFTGYKEPTLWRRIQRRIEATRQIDIANYINYCEANPDEYERLRKDILISVTSFFRDPEAFTLLGDLIQQIVAEKSESQALRIWVPGCATGEESYTIAILIAEAMQQQGKSLEVQLFSTDIDMEAMARARRGLFSAESLQQMPEQLQQRYFRAYGEQFEIIKRLREMVIFARQDLVIDPPFLNLDLISCRNVLIYFQNELQARILATFHFALRNQGYLFLGRSESVLQQEELFITLDKDQRLFRKVGANRSIPLRHRLNDTLDLTQSLAPSPSASGVKGKIHTPIYKQLAALFAPAGMVINEQMQIQYLHGDTSRYLLLPQGTPSQEINQLWRRELRTPLQRLWQAQQIQQEGIVRTPPISFLDDHHQEIILTLAIYPLAGIESSYFIAFEDHHRQGDSVVITLIDPRIDGDQQYQRLIEELDTANEEMLALNEEMQAANEELQATNEEMEATNEELQSTNEELYTVNEELQLKSNALEQAWQELNTIMEGLNYPLLVLDQEGLLKRFNTAAADLFNLTRANRGAHWQLLLHGFSPEVVVAIEESLVNHKPVTLNCDLQRRHYLINLTACYHTDHTPNGVVISMLDHTSLDQAEELAQINQQQLSAAMHYAAIAISIKDQAGRYQFVNPAFEQLFQLTHNELKNQTDYNCLPQKIAEKWHSAEMSVMEQQKAIYSEERIEIGGNTCHLLSVRYPVINSKGVTTAICSQMLDISKRVEAEEELRRHHQHLQTLVEERVRELIDARDAAQVAGRAKSAFMRTISHEVRTPLNIISGMSGLLQRRINDESTLKYLNRIQEGVDRLVSVFDAILDYAELEAGKQQTITRAFSVVDLIKRLATRYTSRLRNSEVTMQTILDPDLPDEVIGDPYRSEQILSHIIDNACKFTRQGYINIEARIRPDTTQQQLLIDFIISDSGSGISQEAQRIIFDSFSHASEESHTTHGGLGLGLAIVSRLLTLLGGTIQLQSEPGKGSIFTATLPFQRPPSATTTIDHRPIHHADPLSR